MGDGIFRQAGDGEYVATVSGGIDTAAFILNGLDFLKKNWDGPFSILQQFYKVTVVRHIWS